MTPVVAVIAALTAVAALAGLAEVSARLLLRMDRGYYAFAPGARREWSVDTSIFPRLAPTVHINVNSDGERGSEYQHRQKTFRILVAGGSAAECLYIDQPDTWPSLVERHLSTPEALDALGANHVHVGTIGKSAMHSGSVRLILSRVLPRYEKLDAIVLMMGVGDPLRWIAHNTLPEGLPAPVIGDCFEQHPEHQFGWEPRMSALAEAWRRRRTRSVERREGVGRFVARMRAQRNNPGELRTTIASPDGMVAGYEANLRGILSLAKAHARHVLVARQPWLGKADYSPDEHAMFWNFGIEDSHGVSKAIFYDDTVAGMLLDRIDAASARVAREMGVAEFSVRGELTPSVENFYDQFHFTPAGNRIVGRVVAAELLALASARS